MYVDESIVVRKGKPYTRYLLRESYRHGGAVRHRTIANLSRCSPGEIEALRLALRHKRELSGSADPSKIISVTQGLSVGAVWLIYHVARQLQVVEALGKTRSGKLALWQIISRVIGRGSPLPAVNLAQRHAACELLGLGAFGVDDLDRNLEWISKNKAAIEERLFRRLHPMGVNALFLYDITDILLHDEMWETPFFGLTGLVNKEPGTVIMLYCDMSGAPLSVEASSGKSPEEFASQIRNSASRFGEDVTLQGRTGPGDLADVEKDRLRYLFSDNVHGVRERSRAWLPGNLFVSMLAYLLVRELAFKWRDLGLSAEEGIDELSTLFSVEVFFKGGERHGLIPEPQQSIKRLFEAAGVLTPANSPLRKMM